MNIEQLTMAHNFALSFTGDFSQVPYHPGFAEQCGSPEGYKQWIEELSVYYAYLYGLVQFYRLSPSRVIVELGRLYGGSTLAMLLGMPSNGNLYSFDLTDDYEVDCLRGIQDRRLHRLIGNTMEVETTKQLPEGAKIDILFIDTDHNYAQISKEWEVWRPLVKSGGIIVLDDIHLNEEMERFWDEITEPKIDTGTSLHSSGFGIVGIP